MNGKELLARLGLANNNSQSIAQKIKDLHVEYDVARKSRMNAFIAITSKFTRVTPSTQVPVVATTCCTTPAAPVASKVIAALNNVKPAASATTPAVPAAPAQQPAGGKAKTSSVNINATVIPTGLTQLPSKL